MQPGMTPTLCGEQARTVKVSPLPFFLECGPQAACSPENIRRSSPKHSESLGSGLSDALLRSGTEPPPLFYSVCVSGPNPTWDSGIVDLTSKLEAFHNQGSSERSGGETWHSGLRMFTATGEVVPKSFEKPILLKMKRLKHCGQNLLTHMSQ